MFTVPGVHRHWTVELKIPTTKNKTKQKSSHRNPQKPKIEPLAHTELNSCVKVEMAILGSPLKGQVQG